LKNIHDFILALEQALFLVYNDYMNARGINKYGRLQVPSIQRDTTKSFAFVIPITT
jgi:hypothetical protein